MFSIQNTQKIINWTPPVYHCGKTSAYIDFTIVDPNTGLRKRKKYMLDRYPAGQVRDMMAAQIIANIYNNVMTGWNPWISEPIVRKNVSLSKIIERYKTYINNIYQKNILKKKTFTDYSSRLKVFEEYLNETNRINHYAYQINRTFAVDFLDYILLDRDVSARTRNNYRTWFSTFCAWMCDKQYITDNPVSGISNLPENSKFRDALTPADLHKLSAYLRTHDKRFFLAVQMEYYTFIRPTELSNIRLSDISIEHQTVYVSSQISKNRRDGMVALNDKIIKLMIELDVFKHTNSSFLFGRDFIPSEHQADARIFRDHFVTVRRALDFPDTYQFYSLKDSGIRDLANAEGIVVARDQARHTDIAVTNKYLCGKDKQVNEDTKHFDGEL